MTQVFDFDKALSELQAGKDLTGKYGVLMPLIKQLTEVAHTAELDHQLVHEAECNKTDDCFSADCTCQKNVEEAHFQVNTPSKLTVNSILNIKVNYQ